MTSQSLSEFIEQLRKTSFAFPLLQKHRIGTVCILPYSVEENKLENFAANIEKQLSFIILIEEARHKLETETATNNKSLFDYIENLQKIFSGYDKESAYPAHYFTRVLSTLNAFHRIVELYNQRDKELLAKLNLLLPAQGGNDATDPYSENIVACTSYRARYVETLQKYLGIFNDFLQRESDRKQGVQVITRSEQYLTNLTNMIRNSIYISRSMRNTLDKLKDSLLLAQIQVQYN